MKIARAMGNRWAAVPPASACLAALLLAASARAEITAAPSAVSTITAPGPTIQLHADPLHEDGIRLGRAALEQTVGHNQQVIEQLEGIDFGSEPQFPEADRAAFLLAQAYLRAGSAARFAELAREVSTWRRTSVYTQWIAFERLLAEAQGTAAPRGSAMPDDHFGPPAPDSLTTAVAIGMDAADALAASMLLRQGNVDAAQQILGKLDGQGETRAMIEYLRAQASGMADTVALKELADHDTTTSLGRDLAGAARIRLATIMIGRGKDPAPVLEGVSNSSRYWSRAREMMGLHAIERGDPEGGRGILESLLATDSTYVARREVELELAAEALGRGDWGAALAEYQKIDLDWRAQRDSLQRIVPEHRLDQLWASWNAGGPLSDVLALDAEPARKLAAQLEYASSDLTVRPAPAEPELAAPPPSDALPWPVAPPPALALREVARAGARANEAGYDVERTHMAADEERQSLADLRRYLGLGLAENGRVQDTLRTEAAHIDSLASVLDNVDARLRAARDEAKRRIVARAAQLGVVAERQLAWASGMRLFYLEGPYQKFPRTMPAGIPTPDSMTRVEESLARDITEFTRRMAAGAPDLIDRSYQHAWRPNLIERTESNRAEVWRLKSWAERLDPPMQTALTGTSGSLRLEQLAADEARQSRSRDSLRVAYDALREKVASDAIAQALVQMQTEREGIDYGLASSSYALSVGLALSDSTVAAAPPDTANDDPEAAQRRQAALGYLEAFLKNHPDSPARGETRFRLADLMLVDARQEFRGRMARYLADQSAGRAVGAPPVLSYAPAYHLYQSILQQDLDYPHLDAVRFNAGMILADQGDPASEKYFHDLVTMNPDSRYAQESWARMGDQHFNDHDFAGSIPLYQHAAEGSDVTLRAISLYKMGWAQFNGEHFLDAANAFQAVMDVYDSTRGQKIEVDIQGEAESYLVHSLARAGGATAFAQHFDQSGSRPYEQRVLRGLAAHFRRYSLYGEAADAEKLYLTRYPHDADALGSAERLAETYERWDHPELARQARLENAARFAPQSDWADAQQSDSIRTAGANFAKSAWITVAWQHHLAAREKGAPEDWQEAQRLYQQVLTWWPHDPQAPLYELYSGEASAHLGDYQTARAHYATAASTGPDSVAMEAMWQRVAVTDAWYEKSRASKNGLGADSLAHAVIQANDDLAARYPSHPHAPDARWRSGHLALAHGWYDRAATDFGVMATRDPKDPRAPSAAVLQADALFQLGRFGEAGQAYETALPLARSAHSDSLAKKAESAIPVCYYRQAESEESADSTAFAHHAELFQQIATRWPKYQYAALAEYRAGLEWARAGKTSESVAAMEKLIHDFPKSEYVRDAHLRIAKSWEDANQPAKAGEAYASFATDYPSDSSAAAASLKAADLFASGGMQARADTLRLGYVRKNPNDIETAMDVYEALARRDLATVSPNHPISVLLASERAPQAARKTARHGKSVHPAPAPATPPASSYLAEYLRRAHAHPKLANDSLIAEVRFQQGEEAFASYDSVRLTQPLPKSIPVRQRGLDSLMAAYRRCADVGVPVWARASAFRIGQGLIAFGTALERSERPADLQGEDLKGYDQVLEQQAQAFYDRGEGVWTDLLKKGKAVTDDPWIARAQTALWGRLGGRFYFRPEVEYPLVAGSAPSLVKPAEKKKKDKHEKEAHDPLRQAREQMTLSPSPYWPYALAQAHLEADSVRAAEAELSASLERDSTYAPALSLMAKLDFDRGHYADAIALLENARAQSKELPQAILVGLALQYDAVGQSDQARAVLGKEKVRGAAGAYLALRGPTPEDGAPLAEQALKDDPKSAANQNNYGIARLRAGDPTAAREAFEKAIALDARLPGPYYNLAILEKFFVLDDEAASKAFGKYWNRSHDDPDRLAQAFGVSNGVAEKKD